MSILRADSIRDRAGTGAPNFPNGATVTGVITATSFSGSLTGNATGLTGTPSITVQNATVQGNLTVNGTTSTIDTVITAVDSLNVEGNVGIGTDNPSARLDVEGNQSDIDTVSGNTVFDIAHFNVSGATNQAVRFYHDDTNNVSYLHRVDNGGDLGFSLRSGGTNTERLRITSSGNVGINSTTPRGSLDVQGRSHFGGGLVEKFEDAGTTLALQTDNPLSDGNVILFTGNESGNTTINFTGVHSSLAQGENVSFTAIISPNGSGVINAVQIDGVAQTVQWSGGSVPTAGASGRDVYTFTLLKNGTTTTSYLVFGAATNYA